VAVRADPDRAVTRLYDRPDLIRVEPVLVVERLLDSVLPDEDAAAVGAAPEASVLVDAQAPHVVVWQSVLVVEARRAHAVEAQQPFHRAEPQVSVRSLGDGLDRRVLREAGAAAPHAYRILSDGAMRIEGERG
jgi:hypothetical protein